MIADVDGDFVEMSREDMPTQVPLLVTRNIVPYPGIVTTIFVARHSSLTLVREYEKNKGFITQNIKYFETDRTKYKETIARVQKEKDKIENLQAYTIGALKKEFKKNEDNNSY